MKIDEQMPANTKTVKQNLSVLKHKGPPGENTISQVSDKVDLISMTDTRSTTVIEFQYLAVGGRLFRYLGLFQNHTRV